MPQAIGGTNIYPSLESIAQLFRSRINDDMSGATNTPGEGSIATDNAPFMMPFMNSAMEDLFSDLRIVQDQELLFDNYVLENLPVVNGPQGLGVASPETQCYLGYNGFFDGTTMWPGFTLPISCRDVLAVRQRQTGSGVSFTPVPQAAAGLPSGFQTAALGSWEYRQNAIWMPGTISAIDLWIRGTLAFVDFINIVNYTTGVGTLNFATTYFPIKDSKNAIVAKMLVQYAQRFSPESLAAAQDDEAKKTKKLKQEIALQKQTVPYQRADWGGGAGFWSEAIQL